jgi:hypothetical protein
MVARLKARTYEATPDKILHLVTAHRHAGMIVIAVLAVPFLAGLSLGPHAPYARKRVRSGTPRYDSRQAPDHRKRPRSPWRSRPDWAHNSDRDRGRDRDRQFYEYDRERQGGSPRRYRPPPTRRIVDTYRPPSSSPAPPSPRQYRYSPRPGYHERSSSPEYDTQRFVGSDVQGRESERINTNVRHYEPTSMEARHTVGREEQRWQRPTPSPSDRDRTPTPPPRLADPEVGLLDRINMNEAETRGRGRGRLLPGGVTRGGPNPRRGSRGGPSGGPWAWCSVGISNRPTRPIIADDWDYDPRRHTPSGIGTRTLVV